ncbi:AIC_G0016030.mRNA.1.CDS.1 [Saccharomyces cerevisiae]|nr:Oxa1p [Saccharomyces cerevisiae YJM270]CAI4425746.1 AIC_G0016030.mRNA.1.CDS.1 [Saccharomyces cerevisiae]CAI6634658.1 AIC_G0016030.mRNA.1.CDS.1 [Saccharomyces cerevisiae]
MFKLTSRLVTSRFAASSRLATARTIVLPRPHPSWISFQAKRFNSTGPNANDVSEIQTQLPSIDELTSSAPSLSASTSDLITNTTQTVGELSSHIGYLNSIGLAQTWYWPSDIIQHVLEAVHVYSGLPWWGTIAATTILIRCLMFPLYVKSSDTVARNSHIKPELDALNNKLMSTTDLQQGQLVAMQRKKLLSSHGIKNRWLAAPMLQIPIALGFFNALRHMANYPVDGFANQGVAWFTDLTQADPYLGLQVITAAVFISFTRLGGETGAQQFSSPMKRLFTILPIISIPATMNLSSAVVLYFAFNGAFSVLQTMILRNKWVRSKLKITEVAKPRTPIAGASPTENMGIFQSLKHNIQKARDQAERRQLMQDNEKKLQESFKEKRQNSKIKIVHKSNFINNKK